MNLKLLKKFVELANHNPNDHEANSAARRVCKMLEESNYKITPDIPKPNIPEQVFTQPDPINWEGFARSQNPRKSSDQYKEEMYKGYRDEMHRNWGNSNPFTGESYSRPQKQAHCNKCKFPFTVDMSVDSSKYVCLFCIAMQY